MEEVSSMADYISIIVGFVSIGLAFYAIYYAKKESQRSEKNYNNTKELLKEIDHKTELIDRGVQFQQRYLYDILNKVQITMKPLTLKEIDEIIEGKTAESKKTVKELEDTIKKIPKIRVGQTLPTDLQEGEIFLQIE